MNFTLLTVIKGGEAVTSAAASDGVSSASDAVQQAGGSLGFFSTPMGIIVYIIAIIAIFYFIGIRPQRKREKKLNELQSEIKIGDWVLLDSGIYGKVTDISDRVFTIEFGTNKGVLIPVLRQRVISKGEPDFSVATK